MYTYAEYFEQNKFSVILKTSCLLFLRNPSYFRSSHRKCSIKTVAPKNFTIFTGEYPCWSLLLIRLSQECKFIFTQHFLFTQHVRWMLLYLRQKETYLIGTIRDFLPKKMKRKETKMLEKYEITAWVKLLKFSKKTLAVGLTFWRATGLGLIYH